MARSRQLVGLPVLSRLEVPLYSGDARKLAADLQVVSRGKLAETIACLSFPGKMDCPAWGIAVEHCRTGGVLANKAGTVCNDCYAARGTFRFSNTQKKLRAAYEGLFHPLWVPAQIQQISWHAADRFRWLFAGDLQDRNHLRNIIRVCRETPWVRHWLPTREPQVVLGCQGEIPPNLTVRASGNDIDSPPPRWWPVTSTVVTVAGDGTGVCPSSREGGNCGDHGCTACWDREVTNVAYLLH